MRAVEDGVCSAISGMLVGEAVENVMRREGKLHLRGAEDATMFFFVFHTLILSIESSRIPRKNLQKNVYGKLNNYFIKKAC